MSRAPIKLELLPHERAALLKWNMTSEVQDQLQALAPSDDVQTITLSRVAINFLASDLNHVIVKRGCRDIDAIELCERLEYVEQSGDGSLDSWY